MVMLTVIRAVSDHFRHVGAKRRMPVRQGPDSDWLGSVSLMMRTHLNGIIGMHQLPDVRLHLLRRGVRFGTLVDGVQHVDAERVNVPCSHARAYVSGAALRPARRKV